MENVHFRRSKEFRLIQSENQAPFFESVLGRKILTDEVGRAVWESLPASGSQVLQKVRKDLIVSKRLILEFLYVFSKAGIIKRPGCSGKSRKTGNPSRMPEDLVSVIVVTYNGERFIEPCFRSIEKQTYKNIEVICVDNASSDKTVPLLSKGFPGVRVIAFKKNRHYAAGINRGIKEAKGRYFFILNQDIELDKDCILRLMEKAKSDKKAGAVAPMMKFSELRGFINGIGNQVNNHGWGTDNFIHCVDIGQFEELREIPSACFGAVMLQRAAAEEVGLVDSGYGSFYEDVDWSLRCWYRGWRIVPAPRAVAYHDFGGSYEQEKKLFFVVRNRQRMVLKLFQGRVMLGFLKNYMREDLRNLLSFLKHKNKRLAVCYVKAYVSLGFHLPGIGIKRLKVMRRKKGIRERDILVKNPSFYCCLQPQLNMPEIDTAVIRRYYRWSLLEEPVPSAVEDTVTLGG